MGKEKEIPRARQAVTNPSTKQEWTYRSKERVKPLGKTQMNRNS